VIQSRRLEFGVRVRRFVDHLLSLSTLSMCSIYVYLWENICREDKKKHWLFLALSDDVANTHWRMLPHPLSKLCLEEGEWKQPKTKKLFTFLKELLLLSYLFSYLKKQIILPPTQKRCIRFLALRKIIFIEKALLLKWQ
jgi:hypothetical protein